MYSAKRFIGRRWGEVDEESKIVSYKVVKGPNDAVRFEIRGKQYAPEEISAQVLRKLADDAAKFLGERVTEAVITVPAYFDDAQRQATRDAGRLAGLEVMRLMAEPTAAAVACASNRKKSQGTLRGVRPRRQHVRHPPSSSWSTACSRSARPAATRRARSATTSTSGWSTGWPTSSSATRASTCATTRRRCSGSTRPPRSAKVELSVDDPDAGQPAVRHRRRQRAPST